MRKRKYQFITADNAEEMQNKIRAMEALGYVPVGSIICGTREETIEHNIKGATTVHQTYLKQSFWYAPNADSAIADCVMQHKLLTQVVETSVHPDGAPEEAVIDSELIEVIESYLRGDA
jgi:hypothetical protein